MTKNWWWDTDDQRKKWHQRQLKTNKKSRQRRLIIVKKNNINMFMQFFVNCITRDHEKKARSIISNGVFSPSTSVPMNFKEESKINAKQKCVYVHMCVAILKDVSLYIFFFAFFIVCLFPFDNDWNFNKLCCIFVVVAVQFELPIGGAMVTTTTMRCCPLHIL